MEVEEEADEMQDERTRSKKVGLKAKDKLRTMSRSRSQGTQIVRNTQEEVFLSCGSGEYFYQAMERVFRKIQHRRRNEARAGEGDRHIYDMMPKHLFSGKRKQGHNDRR